MKQKNVLAMIGLTATAVLLLTACSSKSASTKTSDSSSSVVKSSASSESKASSSSSSVTVKSFDSLTQNEQLRILGAWASEKTETSDPSYTVFSGTPGGILYFLNSKDLVQQSPTDINALMKNTVKVTENGGNFTLYTLSSQANTMKNDPFTNDDWWDKKAALSKTDLVKQYMKNGQAPSSSYLAGINPKADPSVLAQ